MSNEKKKDKPGSQYKDTVNLPRTDFPMKADLVLREPKRLEQWDAAKLYHAIQDKRKAANSPKFLLHDGPPFANGDVHMGTALNKLLKDLVLKSKTMAGFETPFVPGWDCHGLPIEFKVVREAAGLTPVEIRTRSEAFARGWIDTQRNSFKRLGVFADWENPYLTLSAGYEADITRFFATCIDKKLVYRSKRPVLWSYGAQTALAEAEVEYKQKTSPSVFVKFPAVGQDYSFVIWTTTPWTLPANLGIAVHPKFEYVIANFSKDGATTKLVVAKPLVEAFTAKTGWAVVAGSETLVIGETLVGQTAQHPFLDRISQVIPGTFVTADTGTGQVHIAPGHGMEDYIAGRENGLGLISPVDDAGKFTDEVGVPELVGVHVFTGNKRIIEILTERDNLLGEEAHLHDYPHCWRSKTPIIYRSLEQFFLRIDDIRATALAEIDKVEWLPHWGRNRIYGTVESRPDWCISRQRTWGVPLPVFYTAEGDVILDAALARKVADLIAKHGTNYWFSQSDADLAAELGLPEGSRKGKDTLDVWIDSGCSSIAVTENRSELGHGGVADLYIEATDQHRGWFQSSLMCSVIHRGKAPYKKVLTHGFVTDTSGEKISKSGDKPINAEHFYNSFGADIVRLWVSSVDYRNDVPFSEDLFKQTAETYRRIRNTFRILLGNLCDFTAATDAVANENLTLLDQWILEKLHVVTKECVEAYAVLDFRKVYGTLNQFCAVDLSALYVDATKDRMYCDAVNSPRRRSAQTAMHRVLESLCKLAAPILAFTADEAWESLGKTTSVHLESFPEADPHFAGTTATAAVEELQKVRAALQQEVEKARVEKVIGANLEAEVTLEVPESSSLPAHADAVEFFNLSDFTLVRSSTESVKATIKKSSACKCERCWKYLPSVGTIAAHPTLCDRCASVVG
jgi:isoleucyl-tRNA synthetase